MLPRQLYELLPFIYIVTGILCAILVDSTIVLISSILLIVTGVFILIMRRNFRQARQLRYQSFQPAWQPDVGGTADKRSGVDRRQRETNRWPAVDDAGETVSSDRRVGERRATIPQV